MQFRKSCIADGIVLEWISTRSGFLRLCSSDICMDHSGDSVEK
jgi:hypothetical protein